MQRWLVLAALMMLTAPAIAQEGAPASPQNPSEKKPADDPVALQLLRNFSYFCLQGFPDDTAMAASVEAAGGVAMPPEEVQLILKKDAGRGWTLNNPEGRFTIMLEHPPFHTCSVRVWGEKPAVSSLFRSLMLFHTIKRKYVLKKPMILPGQFPGGSSVTAAYEIAKEDGGALSPSEAFMIIFDLYDAPAEPGRNVETRLVYQIAQ